MKRSEINNLIAHAKGFFTEHRFHLPPFAFWTPEDWQTKGRECDEIRSNGLGWDLTDFGSGKFYEIGLLLFTLRNGSVAETDSLKNYAEKAMIVRENQVTPMHFHWAKTEDIINRGGGVLAIELYRADATDESKLSGDSFDVSTDGVRRRCRPGTVLRLHPGESICLEPYVYHRFWSETGISLIGEVSKVNDDAHDNRFLEECGRFPAIVEDAPPLHLLCTEYPPAG